eukprot:gene16655-22906_t
MNKESKRETPSVVNFGEKMRFVGTDGSAKMSLSPQNTVHQLKRIIGQRFNDPQVQQDVSKLPFKVKEAPDGGCLVEVFYGGETATFSPEQLMAIVLVDQKRIAESEAGISVTDCVISVPTYYQEPERLAMLSAAKIASLNCLRLINENTATALAYGIYKTDLPDDVAINVAFVDVGHSATQASIVSLRKSGMQVLSHAWDRNTGGRDVDEALFDYFAKQFQDKHKLDIRTNKKASFKLRQGVKKILSANAEAMLNIECIMEDMDMRGTLNRDELEVIAAPVLARVRAPIEEALAGAKLTAADISSVEIVGSATRTPSIFKTVEDVFGRTPSRTMNSKECVSRGCALQCAMLSPVFKVREFEVIDAAPFAVEFAWEKEGGGGDMAQTLLFERNAPTPATKMLTLSRASAFTITANSPGMEGKVGEWQVGPVEVPAGAEKVKLKVKVRLNLHGLVTQVETSRHEGVESIQSIEEVEVSAEEATKMEDASAAPMDADAPADGPPKPEVTDKKKRVKKHDVKFEVKQSKAADKKKRVKTYDVKFEVKQPDAADETKRVQKHDVNCLLVRTAKEIEDMFERECQMQAADRFYVYSLRNRLYESLGNFASAADKEKLIAACGAMEDWLYNDGEDVSKSVYIAKLDELKDRPPAVEKLRQAIQSYKKIANSGAPQYTHIAASDRAFVMKECESALAWIDEKAALQKLQSKTADPVLLSADVLKRCDTLERVCKPIVSKPVSKPAPAPKPEAPKPEEPAPMEAEPAAEGENMEQ